MSESAYEAKGHELRAKIKAVGEEVREFIQLSKDTVPPADDHISSNGGEGIANAIISFRKLEDAAMRIGKCLQAHAGGVSILDKIRDEQAAKGGTDCVTPRTEPQGGEACDDSDCKPVDPEA